MKRATTMTYSEIETHKLDSIRARYINLSSNDIDITLFDFPNTRQVLEDLEFLLELAVVSEKNPAWQDGYECGRDDKYPLAYDDGYDDGYHTGYKEGFHDGRKRRDDDPEPKVFDLNTRPI